MDKKVWYKKLTAPPVFLDDQKTRIAALVNGILLIIAVGAVLLPLLSFVAQTGESRWLVNLLSLIMIFIVFILKQLLNRGRVLLTGTLLSLTLWISFTFPVFLYDGIRDTAMAGYYLAIIITSLVLGGRILLFFSLLASLSILTAYLTEINGILTTSFTFPPSGADVIAVLVTLNATALLAGLTVRRMAAGEKKLRRERDKAQTYLDVTGTTIVTLDANQNVTLINKKGCQLLGYSEKEIIGQNWIHKFVPPQSRALIDTAFSELMAGKVASVEYIENPILTKTGEERLIAWHNTVLKDENQKIFGTHISGEDITDRKQAEETLKDSEEKYRLLVETSNDAIAISRKGKFIFFNRSFIKLLGYSAEEISGMDYTQIFSPRGIEILKDREAKRNQGKSVPSIYESFMKKKNGKEITIEANAVIIDYQGEKATFASIRDITKQKELLKTLKDSLEKTRGLKGFIPICASCKKIRDDEKPGEPWLVPERYIIERIPEVQFSHSICPECIEKYYPEYCEDN